MKTAWIMVLLTLAWAARGPLRAALSARFARAYPAVSGKLRWLTVAALALLGVTGWYSPQFLWLVAAAALLLGCLDRWRGRPAWGSRRGWPPGSLAIFPATWADDRFYLRQAKIHGAVFKTSHFFRPAACVVGLAAASRLLREHGDRLEAPFLPFSEFVPGGMLRYMREPQHSHYRAIFRHAFSLNVIRRFEPVFLEHTQHALDRLAMNSKANPGGVDPSPHTSVLMLEMWLQLFFAIRPGSVESRRLLELYPVIDITNPLKASPARIRRAVADIRDTVLSHLDGSDELPACLWSAVYEENPEDARDPVVMGNFIFMLATTASDMSALFDWILKKACDHPDWMERVAAEDPSGLPEKPLAECFVLETLRMRQSEFIYRAVVHDFEFSGFHFPRGWLLRICVWESHRDPSVFDSPDQFNPGRFRERSFSRDEFSPFGISSHACLATFLVSSVASVFVRELAVRYRISSPAGGEAGKAVFLAATRHWAPGLGFRIQLQPRS